MAVFLKILRNACVALGAFALAGCAATGGPLGLSPAQEQAIGEQQHPQIVAAFGGEINDPQLKAYVQRIFDRLVAASDQPDYQFKLTVLDSPVVNAMALPGHVYVTRGLLALANSEAELAGVLGHEIGHVYKRHTAKRVSRGNLAQIGTVAAAILTGDAQTAQAIGQGAQLYLLNFSRSQEYESDLVGTRLLARAGYDPIGAAQFLNTLGAWTNLEAQIAGVQQPPEYLKTHPNSANRVARAAQEANALRQAGGVSDERNRELYFRQIDGLLYGEDPVTQGFIDGRTFVHPQIGISFSVPSGFELRNTSSAVIGRAQNGSQMQFSAANSSEAPTALIDGPLSQSLKINMAPARAIQINGRSAAVGQARTNTQGGAVDVTAYVIRWEGTTNYIFLWITPANASRQLERPIAQSVQSLRNIDPRSVRVPPTRKVDIVTAQRNDTVPSLSQYMVFPGYKQERFLIMNGLPANGQLRAGEQYKLIR